MIKTTKWCNLNKINLILIINYSKMTIMMLRNLFLYSMRGIILRVFSYWIDNLKSFFKVVVCHAGKWAFHNHICCDKCKKAPNFLWSVKSIISTSFKNFAFCFIMVPQLIWQDSYNHSNLQRSLTDNKKINALYKIKQQRSKSSHNHHL